MTTYRVGRGLLATGLIVAALSACGGGGGDDSPPAVTASSSAGATAATATAAASAGRARARRRRHFGRYLRRDQHRPARDFRPRRSGARHRDRHLGPAVGRNRGRTRHTRRWRNARRVVRARQHRPPLHDQHHHRRRNAQVDAGRGRRRHHRTVHGALPAPNSASTSIRSWTACAWSATPDRICASTPTPAQRSPTRRSRAAAPRAPA